jgi:LPXTG-motif cell wall-anchored protein
VTYVYTKNPAKVGNVTVNYQDAEGKQIAASKTLTGNVGTDYQAVQASIDGYTFKQVNGNATGQFSAAAQKVTYVYTKNPAKVGNVTVNYQDAEGKQIAASKTLTGNVGTDYQAVQASVDGYTFKQVNGNATGQFSDKAQTVTYVYTKNVTKPIQVIDQSGTKTDNQGNQLIPATSKLKPQQQSGLKMVAKQGQTNQTTKSAAKHKQQLPQTGVAKVNGLLGAIGALLMAVVGMVFKRRKN